jgi:capsular exopolysaccharide synthesis family protein
MVRHVNPNLAERFRGLAVNVATAARDRDSRGILITSARAAEGKSTVSAQLACALAEDGVRTLIVDGDLRKPSQSRQFALREDDDETAAGGPPPEAASVAAITPNLALLAVNASGHEPGSILRDSSLRRALENITHEYDLVLFDTPPALAVSDASILARNADGVIVVIRAGVTTADEAREVVVVFQRLGLPVVGIVLVGARTQIRHYYDGGAMNFANGRRLRPLAPEIQRKAVSR